MKSEPAYIFISNINTKNDYHISTLKMEIQEHHHDLSEIIDAFREFLMGCGFYQSSVDKFLVNSGEIHESDNNI